MDSISYGRQYIDNKDIVGNSVIKKEKLTTGDQVDKFEKNKKIFKLQICINL